MASLKNKKRKEILYQVEDIILFNPTKVQENELREKIENSSRIANGEVDITCGMNVIRYILTEFTNIDNEELLSMSDEEIDEKLDNDLEGLSEAIRDLVETIGEKMAKDYDRQLKTLNQIVRGIEMNKSLEDFSSKYDKIAKKNKLPSFKDIIEKQNEIENLENKIKEEN